MISTRFINDGNAALKLNPLQVKLRDLVSDKLRRGIYQLEEVKCSICGTNHTELLSEKDRYGIEMPVVICKDCGLIYTAPRMNQQSYAAFYDSEYRPLYHGYEAPYEDLFKSQYEEQGPEVSRFLVQQGLQLEGKRVFEVGCGAGGTLAYFRDKHGCDVAGCDFGTEAITVGRDCHQLDLQKGELSSAKLRWQPDILIYSHVFEHILNLEQECKNMASVLDLDGMVYIEIPSVKNIRRAYRWDFLLLLQNAHTYHFTLATLSNVMAKNGFSLVSGTEFVKALFNLKPSEDAVVNDYGPVMSFLKTTEFLRPLMSPVSRLASPPQRLAKAVLRRFDLLEAVRGLLNK